MGKGQERPRHAATVKIGVLAAVLMLTLLIPTFAFAANTASFGSFRPPNGSFTSDATPKISVNVYDRYGVTNGHIGLYIDGVKKSWLIYRYPGYGYRKFKVVYYVPSALSSGSHTVKINVRDRQGHFSTMSWSFSVDTVPPVTNLIGVVPEFINPYASPPVASGPLFLSATDSGSGVAQSYFSIDGAAPVAGVLVFYSFGEGNHTIEYWSVDNVGNVEPHHLVSTNLTNGHSLPTAAADSSCISTGCHGGVSSVLTIHQAVQPNGCPCHALSILTNDCIACHGASNPPANHAVHLTIGSSSPSGSEADCTKSGCHGSALYGSSGIHPTCATCHNPVGSVLVDPALVTSVIAAGVAGDLATCESCHGAFPGAHAPGNAAHALTGDACWDCHGSTDVSVIHTAGVRQPGCVACHFDGTPTKNCLACHPNLVTTHEFVHNAGGVKSTACVECHGDIPDAHAAIGCFCHFNLDQTGTWLRGEVAPFFVAGATKAECVDCHAGAHAAHGFDMSASGHNTLTFGTVGAFSKWDGSEGVVVKDSEEDTITQEWPLPTSGVFWSQSKALNMDGTMNSAGVYSLNPTDSPTVAMANRGGTDMASKINTDVGWGSVITCQDCHTDLSGALGPQGANAGQFGLDPNFPDDWTKGEITSFDPTGMRSIESTMGSANPYYAKLGSKVWPPEGSSGTTDKPNVTKNGVNVGTATISEGGFYDTTSTPSTGYAAGVVTGRFICQKCHKLTNSYQGLGIEGNSRGFRSNNFNYMGFSNEAHMEHHADMVTGQANCVSCHVAIPHAWKRPRLLVYESDPAPYKVQWVFPGYQDAAQAKALTADLSQGNWGFLGWNGLGSAPSSLYKVIGAAIPNGTTGANVNEIDPVAGVTVDNTGKTYSSHLEKLSAADTALKELAVGPAELYEGNDTFNGTAWGSWNMASLGSEWLPDTSPNALYSGEAIQNNCNACTSAGATHSDTGGTGEGVAETAVPGRTPVGGSGTWSRIPFWK